MLNYSKRFIGSELYFLNFNRFAIKILGQTKVERVDELQIKELAKGFHTKRYQKCRQRRYRKADGNQMPQPATEALVEEKIIA